MTDIHMGHISQGETGDEGTPHLQGTVALKSKWELSRLKGMHIRRYMGRMLNVLKRLLLTVSYVLNMKDELGRHTVKAWTFQNNLTCVSHMDVNLQMWKLSKVSQTR
jgi:hypothetical protein